MLAAAGFDDIFVVNTVSHPAKVALLAELAAERRILVAADEADNAGALSAAAVRAGSVFGIMVEVDTGMDRCGVDTADAAVALARRVAGLPGLRFAGITGYEGHCSLTIDDTVRHERQHTAMTFFTGVAERLEADGLPCPIGSGRRHLHLAVDRGLSRHHRDPGRQLRGHGQLPRPDGARFEHSLTIQASVISRQSDRVIVDAGNKSVAAPADVTMAGHDLKPVRFDEEHGVFAAPEGSALRVGDSVALVPGYSPTTVNWYDAYHVVRDDTVVDIWPVLPRGPGHHGLAG